MQKTWRTGGARCSVLSFVLLFACLACCTATSALTDEAQWRMGNETTLIKDLRAKLSHSKAVPPPGRSTVEVQFSIWKIVDVNEKQSTMTVHGWWRHYWNDPRVTWDPKKFGGIASTVLDRSDLWTPDTVVYSLIDMKTPGIEAVTASSDGSCRWLSQRVITVGCHLVMDAFPFDVNSCNFTYGSNSYGGNVVDVRPRKVGASGYNAADDQSKIADRAAADLSHYWLNEELTLLKVRTVSHERYYSCCPDAPYPEIIYDFHFARQSSTYVTGIVVPLIIATFVAFFTLMMPAPISGSRPALNVSILFTTTAIYFVAGSKLPDLGRLTLISRLYVVSQVINLTLTLVSVLATSVNLLNSENIRTSTECMQRYLMYDKDKNGNLDEEEVRSALSTLGIGDDQHQDCLFNQAHIPLQQMAVGITPQHWQKLTRFITVRRPTVHHNLLVGWCMNWFLSYYDSDYHDKLHQSELKFERVSPGKDSITTTQQLQRDVTVAGRALGHEHEAALPLHPAAAQASSSSPSLPFAHAPRASASGGSGVRCDPRRASAPPGEGHARADAALVSARDNADGGRLVLRDLGFSKVIHWLALLEWDHSVQERFARERIDVEALATLSKNDLAALGVERTGDQCKLILWAHKTMDTYVRQLHECDKKPACPSPGEGLCRAALRDDESARRQEEGGEGTGGFGVSRGEAREGGEEAGQARKKAAHEAAAAAAAHNSTWRSGQARSGSGSSNKHRDGSWKFDPGDGSINIFTGRNVEKHLGAVIDLWALLILPFAFTVYLILEFSGTLTYAVSGQKLVLSPPDPTSPAVLEYIDKRQNTCFRNYEGNYFGLGLLECASMAPYASPP
jgi:hypothetical protein